MKIVLTHDVDSISKPFKHIWERRERFLTKDLILAFLGIKNLYNNIEDIIALEDSYGYRSTFFVPVFLFEMNEEIIDIFKSVEKDGWEVQLHFVYEPNQFRGLFRMQKEFFEETFGKVRGVRAHMLIFNNEVLEVLIKEGILYDSTLRSETVGTFDPLLLREKILEIPIGIMDADLFGRFKFRENQALKYLLRKVDKARQFGSKYFTILFHQESYSMKGGRIYKQLIKMFSKENIKALTCNQVLLEYKQATGKH